MKKILIPILFLGAIISSCVKSNNDPEPTPEKSSNLAVSSTSTPAVSVKISVDMNVGDVLQLGITITPANYDKSLLVWSSSNGSVVSVSKTGLLTAKAQGKATIYISNAAKTVLAKTSVSVFAGNGLKTGLIAYYPFGNGSVLDSSGNNNNGVNFNMKSVPDRFGKENSAFYFNGTTSYMSVKDNIGLRLNNTDFTINYWVNLAQYSSSYGTIVACKRGTGSANGWITGIGGQGNLTNGVGVVGTATFNVSGGTDPFAFGKHVVKLFNWHMVTVEYSTSKSQLSIYIDGVLDTVTNNIPSPNGSTTSDLFIGADSQGAYNPDAAKYLVKGKLDDIRIYNRLLSTTDINTLYHLKY